MLTGDDNYIPENSGFRSIEKVGKFVFILVYRCWRGCSAGILSLILLYWMYGGMVIFLLLASALVGAFYHFQDGLLYFPDQPESSRFYVQSPHNLGIPFDNLYIKCNDGIQINVVMLKQAGKKLSTSPTIIYFHGNAGNIGHRLLNAHLIYMQTGCNVLLVEYRGYGKSEGTPSEQGLYLDAEAAMNYMLSRPDIDHSKIILYGRSLGGAVAIALATHEDYADHVFTLIVENTFTSIPDIAKHLFYWIKNLPQVCYRNQFLSIERAKSTSVPTLFLSGLADQLVPPSMMATLYHASSSPMKRLEKFETGTHNDTWQCYGYAEAINKFINDVYQASEAGLLVKRPCRTAGEHRTGLTPTERSELNLSTSKLETNKQPEVRDVATSTLEPSDFCNSEPVNDCVRAKGVLSRSSTHPVQQPSTTTIQSLTTLPGHVESISPLQVESLSVQTAVRIHQTDPDDTGDEETSGQQSTLKPLEDRGASFEPSQSPPILDTACLVSPAVEIEQETAMLAEATVTDDACSFQLEAGPVNEETLFRATSTGSCNHGADANENESIANGETAIVEDSVSMAFKDGSDEPEIEDVSVCSDIHAEVTGKACRAESEGQFENKSSSVREPPIDTNLVDDALSSFELLAQSALKERFMDGKISVGSRAHSDASDEDSSIHSVDQNDTADNAIVANGVGMDDKDFSVKAASIGVPDSEMQSNIEQPSSDALEVGKNAVKVEVCSSNLEGITDVGSDWGSYVPERPVSCICTCESCNIRDYFDDEESFMEHEYIVARLSINDHNSEEQEVVQAHERENVSENCDEDRITE
eukprot:gene12211-13469_t